MTGPPTDVDAFANRELGPDDVRAYLEAPVSDDEREQTIALIRWFTRRYPSPLERLAYARRAYARWRRARS